MIWLLPWAAVASAAMAAAVTAWAASSASATTWSSAAAAAVPGTIAAAVTAWAFGTSAGGAHGFAIGLFTIEVGLFIGEIAATFEGNGFFAGGSMVRSTCE